MNHSPSSQTPRKALTTAVILATLQGASAHGQELEEVMVTATKRGAASMQDTPISVQALSGDRLTDMGATDFNDFFRLIPGLAVFDQGPGDKRYIIRGINATGAGTVGLYLDEVIITGENAQDGGGRQPDIKLYDLDRVEVLKGPQGTTFGSSSLSGTIRYLTNAPDLSQPELNVSATARGIKGADIGGQAEFAANLPLVEDKLAIRIAGLYLDDKGFIDNRFDEGVNGEQTHSARIRVLYTPTDRLRLNFMAMNQDMETDGPYYFNRVGYDGEPLGEHRQADLNRNPFTDDATIYNATAEYLTDTGTLTATVSRLERDTVFNRDASAAVGPLSVITQPKEREVDSYELRFASEWDGPLQALVGVFAQREDRYFQSRIFPSDPVTGEFTEVSGFSLDRNVSTEVEENAAFMELSYDLSDSLTVTGGLRWFEIEISEVATALQDFAGQPGAGRGPQLGFSENDVIGKLNLSYHVTDDIMLFGQWAQGFRAGGTNDQTAAALADVEIPNGFGSDSLDSYELGVKSTLLDGRLRANASLYYLDWADIQIQNQAQDPDDPAVLFPFRANGGAADIYGLELDLTYSPTPGLEFSATAGFTDAELSEDNPIPSTGMDGDEITYIPANTFSLSAFYSHPIDGTNLNGTFGADLNYVDERNTELRPNNPLFIELDDYSLLNLRLGVEADDWSAVLSVNNVLDDDSVVDVFRIIPGLTPDGFIPQQPRTVAVTFRKRFF